MKPAITSSNLTTSGNDATDSPATGGSDAGKELASRQKLDILDMLDDDDESSNQT